MRRPTRGKRGVVAATLVALALCGCGLDVGAPPTGVQLTVTRDFGARVLRRAGPMRAGDHETVVALLRRNDRVDVGSGGNLVHAIDGLAGSQQAFVPASGDLTTEAGEEWFYYVNGVQPPKGPAATSVHPGDHIWWDLHDPSEARQIPAVVGSFPEPFLNGIEGKRLPVRVECASVSNACSTVIARLRELAVPAAVAAIGSGGAPETLRVMVGPWAHLEGDLEAESIGRGPAASGVYVRFSANGQALTLLDPQGRPARRLIGDAGLVAATRGEKEAPVWVVTGTDDAGVELAARGFAQATLADHFAVAFQAGAAISVPLLPEGTP